MSEQAAGEAGAAAAALAGAQGAGAGAGDTGADSWLSSLPDDLKSNGTLTKYENLEAFARGHIETYSMAHSRVPKPGDTAESREAFYAAIRPADASVYDIKTLEGDENTAFADAFRPVAHKLALQPDQVAGLVEWQNGFVSEQRAAMDAAQTAAKEADVKAFEEFQSQWNAENGGSYDAMLAKAQSLTQAAGWDAELLHMIEDKVGSPKLMAGLFTLAKGVGDLPLHQGGAGGVSPAHGGMNSAQAAEKHRQLQNDPEWRKQSMIDGTPQNRERLSLRAIVDRKKAT